MQNMQIPGFCGAEIQDAGGGVVPDIFQRRPNVDKWRNRAGAVGHARAAFLFFGWAYQTQPRRR